MFLNTNLKLTKYKVLTKERKMTKLINEPLQFVIVNHAVFTFYT